MNGSASTALNGYSKVPLWAHDSRMPTLGWVGVPPHPSPPNVVFITHSTCAPPSGLLASCQQSTVSIAGLKPKTPAEDSSTGRTCCREAGAPSCAAQAVLPSNHGYTGGTSKSCTETCTP
jgi:hypothetical protein